MAKEREFYLPPEAKTPYGMADVWGVTVEEAVTRMNDEGWQFYNYDNDGNYAFLPPSPNEQ